VISAVGTLNPTKAQYVFDPSVVRARAALLLSHGRLYAAFGAFCDQKADVARGWVIGWQAASLTPLSNADLVDRQSTSQNNFFLSGVWMSGFGIAADSLGRLFFVTGNSDPGGTTFQPPYGLAESVIKMTPDLSTVLSYFTPAGAGVSFADLEASDLDFGSGGVLLFGMGKRNILATASKESVIYLLDADNLGGVDHMTSLYQSPRLGNDSQDFQALGTWGSLATTLNEKGERWLYTPMWGAPAKAGPSFPMTNGAAPNGSIMAFKVVEEGGKPSLQPQWISHDLLIASSPVVANGVVYALQTAESAVQVPKNIFNPDGSRKPGFSPEANAANRIMTPHATMTLFAFDAETGKQLWSSGKTMDGNTVHFTQPVVALGKLFAVDHAGHLWAFGLKR